MRSFYLNEYVIQNIILSVARWGGSRSKSRITVSILLVLTFAAQMQIKAQTCTYSTSYTSNSGGMYFTNVYGTGVDATAQINSGSSLPDGSLVSTSADWAKVIRTTSGTDYSQDGDGYFLYIDGDDACVRVTSNSLTVGCTYQVSFWAASWDANGTSAVDVAASVDILASGSVIHVFGSAPVGCTSFNVWYKDQGDAEACSVPASQGQLGYFYNKFSDVTNGIFGNLTTSNTLNWQFKTFTFVATATMNEIYMSKTDGSQTSGLAIDNVCIVQCLPACTNPSGLNFTQTAATCTGSTPNNNGTITLTAATNGTHFGVSTLNAGSYNGPAFAGATAISLPQLIKNNIPNTGGTYIVRIFNGADNCYVDQTVTVNPVNCNCAPIPCGTTTVIKN